MRSVKTEREVDALISRPAAMLKFSAEWCGPCRAIAPVVEKLVAASPQVACAAVDIDSASAIAQRFSVSAVPSFLFFRRGQLVQTIRGANAQEVAKAIEMLAAQAGPAVQAFGRGHRLSDTKPAAVRTGDANFPGAQYLPAVLQTVVAYLILYVATLFSTTSTETAQRLAPRILPKKHAQ